MNLRYLIVTVFLTTATYNFCLLPNGHKGAGLEKMPGEDQRVKGVIPTFITRQELYTHTVKTRV